MKQSFVLSIVLLLLSLSNAAGFVSPSQSPALSPTPEQSNSECSTVIYNMFDCFSFLTVGSTDLTPTKSCCVGLKSVLEYNPNCLCIGLQSSSDMGFEIINSRALAMPSICHIHIDPHCDVASIPTASPPTFSSVPTTTSPSSAKSPSITSPTITPTSPTITPISEPSNSNCSTIIYNMVDCLSFLTVGSTELLPTKMCCDAVESVLEYNPNCLCVGLESSREMGFELINSRAVAMPSICHIHIDPHCDVALTPPSSPKSHSSPAVTASPPSSPATTASPPSSPAARASLPKSPATTASSPSMTAPPPSKSAAGNLSVSKLFLAAVIISSSAYVLA